VHQLKKGHFLWPFLFLGSRVPFGALTGLSLFAVKNGFFYALGGRKAQ
jgi:hypothetical protein